MPKLHRKVFRMQTQNEYLLIKYEILGFLRSCVMHRLFFVLTLNAPIATKVLCFSHLLKCLRSLYGKQRSSLFWVHAVCFYINSSVMLGNYFLQTTFSDAFFSWRFILCNTQLLYISKNLYSFNSLLAG